MVYGEQLAEAHRVLDAAEGARLRQLDTRERGVLIEAACQSAAEIYRSRIAAGLGDIEPARWPESTWEFLRRHAARI